MLSYIALGLGVISFLASPLLTFAIDTAAVPAMDLARGGGLLLAMVGLILAGLALGSIMKGRPLGLMIDRRNRYSLSRFQIMLWTLLVLPIIYTGLMFNTLRAWGSSEMMGTLEINWNLLALMGLSVTSFVASPLALSVKANRNAAPKEIEEAVAELSAREKISPHDVVHEGLLLKRLSSEAAILSDLFRGEETGNANSIDIARIQMLLLTLIVWVTYLAQTGNLFLSTVVGTSQLAGLHEFNSNLLVLLLISHGGYLTGKVVPNSTEVRVNTGRELAHINKIIGQANLLTSRVDDYIRLDIVWEDTKIIAERYKALILSLIEDTHALNDKISTGQLIGENLAHLEGRLDAMESGFKILLSNPNVPLSDQPPEILVSSVQKGLLKRGMLEVVTGKWTATDSKILDQCLIEEGVKPSAMPDQLIKKLEMVESLLNS